MTKMKWEIKEGWDYVFNLQLGHQQEREVVFKRDLDFFLSIIIWLKRFETKVLVCKIKKKGFIGI